MPPFGIRRSEQDSRWCASASGLRARVGAMGSWPRQDTHTQARTHTRRRREQRAAHAPCKRGAQDTVKRRDGTASTTLGGANTKIREEAQVDFQLLDAAFGHATSCTAFMSRQTRTRGRGREGGREVTLHSAAWHTYSHCREFTQTRTERKKN